MENAENCSGMKTTIHRRQFLDTSAASGLGAILAVSSPPAALGMASDRPPNVLFVICDQMRGDALGCLGHANARTPNLDRLAADGVLFENAFCNNPVCVPSRMSMFSGKYPHQVERLTNRGPNKSFLPLEGTLLDSFVERGYRVGWIGKNHTYEKPALRSLDRVSVRSREPFRKYSRFVPPHWHSDTLWPEAECYPRRNTDEAVEFIDRNKSGEPFFLHVSYFDPHPPYMAPAEYSSRYCSSAMQLPPYVPASALSGRLDHYARAMKYDRLTDADLTETLRYYYAAIEWGVDAQMGRLLDALERKGIIDDTIVVFTSDHGDFMGEHRMVRKGMFLYDALLRIPMIWSCPGRMKKGLKSGSLAQCVDIFPTLLDLTAGESRDDLEGRTLKPFLLGEAEPEGDFAVFASAAYGNVSSDIVDPSLDLSDPDEKPLHTRVLEQSMKPDHRTMMLRSRDWKLILNETEPPELYHMDGGWIERENVAERSEHAAVRGRMEARLQKRWVW